MRAIYLQVLAPVIMGSGRGMGRGAVGLVDGGRLPPPSAVPQRCRCGDSLVSSPPPPPHPPLAGLRRGDMMGPFSWAHHSVCVRGWVRAADPS